MVKPRLLVTGGSGYLGDWVVRLARTHWNVGATYFTHPATLDGATWTRLDARDADAVTALVDAFHPDAIIHTAAANPGPNADFHGANAVAARHVARTAASAGARLVHVSTDVIFDGERGNYTEDDLPNPITAYGRSKARAEEAVIASGAEAIIVRTSLIYGWRPHIDRQARWILNSLRDNTPITLFTDELRNPVWVESLAAALLELAGADVTGVLNVAGAQPLSRYDFGTRLARFNGVDPAPIAAASSRASGFVRPRDCTLDCTKARATLKTPLPGVDAVLGSQGQPN